MASALSTSCSQGLGPRLSRSSMAACRCSAWPSKAPRSPQRPFGQAPRPTTHMVLATGFRQRRSYMDFDLMEDQVLGNMLEYPDMYDEEVYEPAPPEPKYINGKRILLNQEISAPMLRVQGKDKEDLGVMSFEEAFALAQDSEVDLLMINDQGNPPVVRLITFSKYKYELDRNAKQRQKASKGVETKEVRLTPVTEPHDYQVKLKSATGFLKKGNKVKLVMNFSGRQLRFKDQGKELILKFIEDLAGVSKVDGPLNLKTSTFTATLAPTKS